MHRVARHESAPFDLSRLQEELSPMRIEFHPEIGSTNDRALALAADRDISPPLLVLAGRQTAGRGRSGNRWWADDGGLAFSLLAGLPGSSWPRPQIALAAGLAVCEALGELLPGHDVRLKWPNDVWLDGRKVCGLLVEVPPSSAGRIVVGTGINVNSRLSDAPEEVRSRAVSIAEAAGWTFDLTDVLIQVVRRMSAEIAALERPDIDWPARWRPRCLLEGRIVHLDLGTRQMVGVCRGLDGDGALILQTETGRERFVGGTVVRFE